jgi:predicted HAD superfamily Cof-like phosphohydrolase
MQRELAAGAAGLALGAVLSSCCWQATRPAEPPGAADMADRFGEGGPVGFAQDVLSHYSFYLLAAVVAFFVGVQNLMQMLFARDKEHQTLRAKVAMLENQKDLLEKAEPAALAATAEFHATFMSPIVAAPALPPPDRARLRLSLLEEEVAELRAAVESDDLVECADALADIQYVLSGAVLEFGMGGVFKQLFDEVHRSNMSKLCSTEAEAEATLAHYRAKDGSEGTYQPREDGFLVLRSDGKTLKSVNYSPCDLPPILNV